MSSMFENISKDLVKELGDKDLRPVKYLLSANKFRQFAILRKKKKTLSHFWELPDIPVEYTLLDILEGSSSVPGIANRAGRQGVKSTGTQTGSAPCTNP